MRNFQIWKFLKPHKMNDLTFPLIRAVSKMDRKGLVNILNFSLKIIQAKYEPLRCHQQNFYFLQIWHYDNKVFFFLANQIRMLYARQKQNLQKSARICREVAWTQLSFPMHVIMLFPWESRFRDFDYIQIHIFTTESF